MRVLLVESDTAAAHSFNELLTKEGSPTYITDTGEEALDLLRHYEFGLVLLNLQLADMSGITVLRRIRAAGHTVPVIALCNGASSQMRVEALSAGADDVADRRMDRSELLARMQVMFRRSHGYADATLRLGALELNIDQRTVAVNGTAVALTGKEFAILKLLLRKNMVMTKEAIIGQLYGGIDEPEPKIIDVFICKTRKKLEKAGLPNVIRTVWGRGFRIQDGAEQSTKPSVPVSSVPVRPHTQRELLTL